MTALWRGIRNGLVLALPCWLLAASCQLQAQQTGPYRSTRVFTMGDTTVTEYVRGNVDSVRRVFPITPVPTPTPTPTPPPTPTPAPQPPGTGIPLGASSSEALGAPFTARLDGTSPNTIIGDIADARKDKTRLLLNMTGGKHSKYMTDPPPNGVFVMAKWEAAMDAYDTPAIKAAVAQAVKDGTIVGNSVMDEPANETPTAGWGPPGTMTKAKVDQMCAYVKGIFPTLPTGVVHDHRKLEPEKVYAKCDFLMSQYREAKDQIDTFLSGMEAFGVKNHMAILPSLNALHGGTPSTTCRPKYGVDASGKLCPMTPAQITAWGTKAAKAKGACGVNFWREQEGITDNVAYLTAFAAVAKVTAAQPAKPCRRTA